MFFLSGKLNIQIPCVVATLINVHYTTEFAPLRSISITFLFRSLKHNFTNGGTDDVQKPQKYCQIYESFGVSSALEINSISCTNPSSTNMHQNQHALHRRTQNQIRSCCVVISSLQELCSLLHVSLGPNSLRCNCSRMLFNTKLQQFN